MPQTIYLPQKKNWWDPMMQQGSNFLWQLAMMKAQHKMSLEKADVEARYNAALKETEHEYKMEEERAKPSYGLEKGKRYLWKINKRTGEVERTDIESPETSKAYQTWKLPNGQTINLQTGVEPPSGAVKYSEPTIAFIGTDAEGKALVMDTKGKPNIRPAGGPAGIGPKTTQRLTPEAQTTLSTLRSINTSIQNVFKNYDPSFVGPIRGRLKKYGSKWFEMPEYKGFQSQTSQLVSIVYGLSGKQISEPERKWLREEILPALEQPGANFIATLEVLDAWVADKYGKSWSDLKSEGFIVGGPGFISPYQKHKEKNIPQQTGKPPLDSFWK